jgi:membrane fusion protein, adhesin transport system
MSENLYNIIARANAFFKRNAWVAKPVHLLLEKWVPKDTKEDLGWDGEIDMAIADQSPLRARRLLHWILGVLIVLVLWASFTKVDEVTRGEGRVIPSGQIQIIQSLDGGIVSEILVKEGQVVLKGDSLVKIDETRAISSLRENRSQYLALLAKQARLTALARDEAFSPPKEIIEEVPDTYHQELALYTASKEELASQIDIAHEQLTQKERELQEVRASNDQAQRGYESSKKELDVTRPLIESGAVSEVDILKLEREASRYQGERDQTGAQIGRIQAGIAEAKRKINETDQNFKSKVRTDLTETTAKLNSISETSVGLADKVSQATLKSPVNGKISRLFINTVGGVIQPGKEVLEIVPSDDALLLETKIQPKDIAFVRPLQNATVKLTAYDYTIYGGLDAIVQNVAPDSVVDEKGNAYYVVKVRTIKSSLGVGKPIIPGMIAQVDIITGKKTVLSYLLKPVLKAKSYAFTER